MDELLLFAVLKQTSKLRCIVLYANEPAERVCKIRYEFQTNRLELDENRVHAALLEIISLRLPLHNNGIL